MAWAERLFQTLELWPYMLPLVAVYFAEYAMQTGTWTAIGMQLRRFLLMQPVCNFYPQLLP